VLYSETFTSQDGKGKFGTDPVDTTGVDWAVDVSNGEFTAESDFFGVNSGVFEAQDVDAQGTDLVVWTSPSFNIQGYSSLEFSFDAFAAGDFEADTDNFIVTFTIDGSTSEDLFTATVDEAAPGDPMFFGSTELTDSLANFEESILGTGTSAQISIFIGNNAGSELQGFDNLSVTGVPEPSAALLLVAALAGTLLFLPRRRAQA